MTDWRPISEYPDDCPAVLAEAPMPDGHRGPTLSIVRLGGGAWLRRDRDNPAVWSALARAPEAWMPLWGA